MDSKRVLQTLYNINISFSVCNNCLAIIGILYSVWKLFHILKKKRYVNAMGKKFGYETCKWKYIEKQLRITLFLMLQIIESLYITLYNTESILRKAYISSFSGKDISISNDCVLINGTYLSNEYDTSNSEIAYNVMKSIQQALFLYGLWIACIFLSHICKAMNKLVERKKFVTCSLLGSIGAVIVFVVNSIPVLRLIGFPFAMVLSQIILVFAMLKAWKYLYLFYQKNKAFHFSYSTTSPYMQHKAWLFKQYFIVIFTLGIIFQLYIMGDLCDVVYIIEETLIKNPCWIKKTLNIHVSSPNLVLLNRLNTSYIVVRFSSVIFKLLFNIGVSIIQVYILVCYIYGRKKPKRKISINNDYSLSSSLLPES